MIIGIDCDEVLSSTLEELIKFPEFNGAKWESFYSYNPLAAPWFHMDGLELLMIFLKLFQSDHFWDIKPVPGALQQLKKLKEAWHELVIITWRPEMVAERTKKWVEEHYPNLFSDFLFASTHTENQKTKAELCEERGIQLVIEDDPFFVSDLSEKGVPCILLDYPRNQDFDLEKHSNVHKIKSRNDFDLSFLP